VSTVEETSIVVDVSIVVGFVVEISVVGISVVDISVVDISVVDISVVEITLEDSKVVEKSFGTFVDLALENLIWASAMACLFFRLIGETVVMELVFFCVDVIFISEGIVLSFSVIIESVVNIFDSSDFIVFFESASVILSSGDCV
jgi:hypothetical protein